MTGTLIPTMRPVCRAKLPVAETTCSQTMSPLSVTTFHSPLRCRSIAVTVVWRLISAAAFARAARQRLGEVGGLDIAVLGVLDRADDSIDIAERPDLLDLLRREELDLDADGRGDAGVIAIFVHPVAGAREADVRHLAQADVEPGLLLERLVERDGIFVDLPDRIAEVEERQEARRVPGRAGGQLLALDENAVAPALLRQMIERRDADHAPADHHRPRMRSHAPRAVPTPPPRPPDVPLPLRRGGCAAILPPQAAGRGPRSMAAAT